jgi:hypothetical protein
MSVPPPHLLAGVGVRRIMSPTHSKSRGIYITSVGRCRLVSARNGGPNVGRAVGRASAQSRSPVMWNSPLKMHGVGVRPERCGDVER